VQLCALHFGFPSALECLKFSENLPQVRVKYGSKSSSTANRDFNAGRYYPIGGDRLRAIRAFNMRFLVRLAFWFCVVLVLLPSGRSQPDPKPQVSAGEAFSAAKAAFNDLQQFCARQPDACSVGSSAAHVIGQRAQAGAKMVYDLLSDQLGPTETGATGAGPKRPPGDTLTRSDVALPWRGPQPRREARPPAS
jgi:Family of unknown function (DUF5330)